MRIARACGTAAVMIGLMVATASAQIKIGAIISITGPTAALGVGYRNAFATFPAEASGKSVTFIIRDDASDASSAVNIAQRMIEDDHVDAIIGPTLTSSGNAVQPIANAAKVPMVVTSPIDYDAAKYPLHLFRRAAGQPYGQRRRRRHEGAWHQDRGLYRLRRRLWRSGL